MIEMPPELYHLGKKRVFPKGTHIYNNDQTIKHCYYIISGTIKIYIDHRNGKRSVLDFINNSNWLGEFSIFLQEEVIKENKVIKEVTCLEYDLIKLKESCKASTNVSFYFASYMASKLLLRSYRMSEFMNYSLEDKLARFILQYQENEIYSIAHTDASEYLNVSYRHILHVIKQFCDRGLLEKEKAYKIVNRYELEKIAKR